MVKHHSEDYKVIVVKYYLNNDVTLREACEIFGCSYKSLYRWKNKYKNKGSIKRKKTIKKPYKITKSIEVCNIRSKKECKHYFMGIVKIS